MSTCAWCNKNVDHKDTDLIQTNAGLILAVCRDCLKAEAKKKRSKVKDA